MDLGLRDWLFIIGPIFVVAVLVHGYWRMRRNSNTLKMSLDQKFQSNIGERTEFDDLKLLKAELPSGGARVVDSNKLKPQQGNLNLDEDVPVLMEPVSLAKDDAQGEDDVEQQQEEDRAEELTAAVNYTQAAAGSAASESKIAEAAPAVIVVIHVFSNGKGFNGQQLLESLVTCGLKFGEMDIFHHYAAGTDKILFSLVNGVEPGTFNLNSMETLTTPAVSLFMRLEDIDKPIPAYETMLDTARKLAAEIDGYLKDESHSVLTNQTIEHWRQTIGEYSTKYR